MLDEFERALTDKNKDQALFVIKRFCCDVKNCPGTLVSNTKHYVYQLLQRMIKVMAGNNLQPPADTLSLWDTVYQTNTIDELAAVATEKIEQFFEQINQNNVNDAIWQVIRHIKLHYRDTALSVQQLSALVSLTPPYLCVLFKNETGKTINQYITDYRIQKSMDLLTSRAGSSLEDIAVQVGYSDANYFSKLFKKKTGLSPSKYKRSRLL